METAKMRTHRLLLGTIIKEHEEKRDVITDLRS